MLCTWVTSTHQSRLVALFTATGIGVLIRDVSRNVCIDPTEYSPDFNGVDGILGYVNCLLLAARAVSHWQGHRFGMPRKGSEAATMPTPLLYAFTASGAQDSNAQTLPRKFAFFSTESSAEVQLGGYDPDAIVGQMMFTPTLSTTDFIVGVTRWVV